MCFVNPPKPREKPRGPNPAEIAKAGDDALRRRRLHARGIGATILTGQALTPSAMASQMLLGGAPSTTGA